MIKIVFSVKNNAVLIKMFLTLNQKNKPSVYFGMMKLDF